jgi:hypothetical protein
VFVPSVSSTTRAGTGCSPSCSGTLRAASSEANTASPIAVLGPSCSPRTA